MGARPVFATLLLTVLVIALVEATDSESGADGGSLASTSTTASSSTGIVSTRNDLSASSTGAMSIPPTMVTVFAVIGAVVVAIVGAGAIGAIVLSLFGIRMCYVLGTCHDPYGFIGAATPYEMPYPAYAQIPYPSSSYPHAKSSESTGNELPQYDAYSQVSYPTGYQKRSLEYVGPILKALGSAYGQQYAQQYFGQPSSQQLGVPGTPRKAAELQSTSPVETNHNPEK